MPPHPQPPPCARTHTPCFRRRSKLDATSNVPTLAGTIPKLGWTLPDTLTRLELLGDKGGKSLTSVIPHYLPVPPRLVHLNL